MNATLSFDPAMKSGMVREYFMGFKFYYTPSGRSPAVENYIAALKRNSRVFVPSKAPEWTQAGFACLVAMSKP